MIEKTTGKLHQKPFKKRFDLLPGLSTLAIWGGGVICLNCLAGLEYPLFRVIVAEIVIICAVLYWLLVSQTYRYIRDEYLLFTGYLFLSGAIFNMASLWSGYRLGLVMPPDIGPGDRFWWIGSYLLGLGLCLAPFNTKSKQRRRQFLGLLALAVLIAIVWIAKDGLGKSAGPITAVTKTVGEYLLLLSYGGALFFHYQRHKNLQPSMAFSMTAALALLILADIGMLRENGSFQPFVVAGYILQLLAYGIILRGIFLVGIKIPYEVIFKELKDSATQDALTGLLNRNGLNEFVTKELTGNPEVNPVGVLVMDLDGFKAINDHYGHARGDYILIEFAKLLKTCVRGTDMICRLGGDEFLVLVQAGQLELNMVRFRIQEAVSIWRERDDTAHQIGVSIGSAMWDLAESHDLQQILSEADQDMYWEKKKRKLLEKSGKKPD